MTNSAEDFVRVQKALKLLRAYRAHLDVPVQDNPEYQRALQDIVEGITTPEEFEAEIGRLVQGQVILANVLVEGNGNQLQHVAGARHPTSMWSKPRR